MWDKVQVLGFQFCEFLTNTNMKLTGMFGETVSKHWNIDGKGY